MNPDTKRITKSGLFYSNQTLPRITPDISDEIVRNVQQSLGRSDPAISRDSHAYSYPVTEITAIFQPTEGHELLQILRTVTLFNTREMITDMTKFLTVVPPLTP